MPVSAMIHSYEMSVTDSTTSPHEHHEHGSACGHGHSHEGHAHFDLESVSTDRLIAGAFWINVAFMILEAVGGWITNSLALLADSAHMLNDVLSLGLTWLTYRLAKRAAQGAYTFGFQRAQVLAALANAASLGVIIVFILKEAISRIYAPEPVLFAPMLLIAMAGFAANLVSGGMLFFRRHENMNIRGAYLHLMADTLGSVLAIIAAILIRVTGIYLFDPILSVMLGLFVSVSAWKLMKESVAVLMEKAPPGYDAEALALALSEIEHVEAIHDLHLWQLDDGRPLASVHVVVSEPASIDQRKLIEQFREIFRTRFHVEHATIQIEGKDWPHCTNHCGVEHSHVH